MHLLRKNVEDFLRDSFIHNNLLIEWYLPETVKKEREYQLRLEWLPILAKIKRVEGLTGKELKIDEQQIIESINKMINTQITELGLRILSLDIDRVDWAKLMDDAAFRRPPFSTTETEKGFRDALILAAIVQLAKSSPNDASSVRIVIVTGDRLLRDAIEANTVEVQNVHVEDSLDGVTSALQGTSI
jgi:hypothetical protein